jgi:hypothetical protein
MKSFIDFINEEAKIHGNIGSPEDFLKGIETKAQRELGVRMDNPNDEHRFKGELDGLIQTSRRLMFGGLTPTQISERVTQLQDLATQVIMHEYSDILNNVDLEIRLVPSVVDVMPEIGQQTPTVPEREQRREAQNIGEEEKEEEKEEEVKDKKKSFLDNLLGGSKKEPKKKENFLKTIEYKQKIDKAKLINNIIQGEAKNTKNILHTEEVKEGLRRIFGRQSDEVLRIWDSITKTADKLDWAWDIESKAKVMSDIPGGMAGAVKVEWPEVENPKSEKDDSSEYAEDILKKIEQGDDLNDQKEEISELLSTGNPRIFAVGVDFPMLLHEAVKGIYELIAAAYLPSQEASKSEISKAKVVKMGTSTFEDEAEDFRYGPYIAAALRDFVNSCPGVDRYPNMREFVFGKMVLLPEVEFLDLMKGIFQKTDKAKKTITDIISDISAEIREWEIEGIDEPKSLLSDVPSYDDEDDNFAAPGSEEEDEISKLIRQTQQEPTAEEEKEIKDMSDKEVKSFVSTLSKRQLQEIIDVAIDSGDSATLNKIGPYMKESLEWKMYESEIKRILKS